jgi:hypothetical protein
LNCFVLLVRLLSPLIAPVHAELCTKLTGSIPRKQMTFFRSFDDLRWVDVAPDDDPTHITERVLHSASLSLRG